MIDGFALGGGAELALAAPFRLAGEKSDSDQQASIAFPEVTAVGIDPGLRGCDRARAVVGQAVAKAMILAGTALNGQQAYETGFVDAPPSETPQILERLEIAAAAAKEPLTRDEVKNDYRTTDACQGSGNDAMAPRFRSYFLERDPDQPGDIHPRNQQ